jgi:hydroxymethylbilane synthase
MKSSPTTIRIGSRGSQLALWQAEWVKSQLSLHHPHLAVQIEIIKTTGDKILDSPLSAIGDKGLFTKELETALLDGRVDIAVHSLKDVPTTLPAGLLIGAVTKREDVRDVFIGHPDTPMIKFLDIPSGGRIATGSLRRRCQLKHLRPDLEIVDVRGNLNTRFAKLKESDWNGMILARAGVVRLGFEASITETLPIESILPAVGQGALGIELCDNRPEIMKLLTPLISTSTTIAVTAERAFLAHLEGGCQVPIGAYARIENGLLVMDGLIGSLDGTKILRGKIHGGTDDAAAIAGQLAASLLRSGGKKILDDIRSASPPVKDPV